MAKNTPFTIQIDRLTHDGRGVGTVNGKTTFVTGALPTETVTAEYIKKRSRLNEAKVIHIDQPASDRIEPECPHFLLCGGCQLQHLPNSKQIQLKQETLLEQLTHIGQVQAQQILPPLTASPWHYRHKARLGARYVPAKQKILVGFREKFHSRFIADLQECHILVDRAGVSITDLQALLMQLSIREHIAQVELAAGDDECALIIRHLQPMPDDDRQRLITYAKQHQLMIYLQPGGMDTITLLWPQTDAYLHYTLPDQSLRFAFRPGDFTQVNPFMNRLMVARAIELLALNETDKVLDLFCGLGNFSLPIAQKCQHVTGVEGCQRMVERANSNARLNQIDNVNFHAADLTQPFERTAWWPGQYNKLLLDPPRSGALEIIQQLAQHPFERIVYVSCNPATLARDLNELVHRQHYQLIATGVMDMFPHTAHVEAIALLQKL
jgi:23S rRNA (uracil1939-C5)-methyltransferase